MTARDHLVDLLIVGSGAGGMVAALVGKSLGLNVLVIEKTGYFGGSTARSGGGVWVPNNCLLAQEGVTDSLESAQLYMKHTVGERVPEKLQQTYLTQTPRMIEWLRDNTCVQFQRMPGYSDYYPERPGGLSAGRSLEPVPFNGNKLGAELSFLRKTMAEAPGGMAITASEYQKIGMVLSTWEGKKTALRIGLRFLWDLLTRVRRLTMGQALSARLRHAMQLADIPLWLNTAFEDLIVDAQGCVIGITAQKENRQLRILARKGVILAGGGFAHNLEMRQKYLPQPTSTQWTVGSPGSTGDDIQAGIRIGADVDLMDDAWWGPSSRPPEEDAFFHVGERAYPGAIMVNGLGQRFVNESAPYIDVVNAMYRQHKPQATHIPVYFIFDQRYRDHYLFGLNFPMIPIPSRYYKNGYFKRAASLADLAHDLGLDGGGLLNTVERFNRFAREGKDLDFQRGDSAYENYYGDPNVKPNPNLAPLEHAPYYAVSMWPGDLGTKGGLKTDEHGRVLRTDGSIITGLFAVGNSMASVMGNSYPGAGATLGPAMTFGYLAAQCAANETDDHLKY
jgi:3-oxosteroid 1-dehydrogenase